MKKVQSLSKKICKQNVRCAPKKHVFGLLAYSDKEFGWMKNEVLFRSDKALLEQVVSFYKFKQAAVASSIASRHGILYKGRHEMLDNSILSQDCFAPVSQMVLFSGNYKARFLKN